MRNVLGLLGLWALALPAAAQPAVTVPDLSTLRLTQGTAEVITTGSLELNTDVALSVDETLSSEGVTWLVFADANVPVRANLVHGDGAVGAYIQQGDLAADASHGTCVGETKLTDGLVWGHYTCAGAAVYDLLSGTQVGETTITIEFSAR